MRGLQRLGPGDRSDQQGVDKGGLIAERDLNEGVLEAFEEPPIELRLTPILKGDSG